MSTSITDDNSRLQYFPPSTLESFAYAHPCAPSLDYTTTSHPTVDVACAGVVYPLAVAIDRAAIGNSDVSPDKVNEKYREISRVSKNTDHAFHLNIKNILLGITYFIVVVFFLSADILVIHQNPKFRIESGSLSPSNISNSHFSAQWNISISLTNLNKLARITFDNFDVFVFYKNEYLSGTIVSPFHHYPKNQTFLNVSKTQVVSENIKSASTRSLVELDISHGLIIFDMRLRVTIRYGANIFTAGKIDMVDAFCEGIEIGFLDNARNGTLLGGPRPCMVKVSRYIED